jgi:DtxR family Mn-dependent transcriptional regulator
MINQAMEDYLKVTYKLQKQKGLDRVSTSAIAEALGLSAASVTNMLKRLSNIKLINYNPYRGVELTEAGEKVALEVIRHHRLIELYLAEALGYSWDKVDAEAEKLEHSISEEFEDKIDEILGYPTEDPHGDPIPAKDGTLKEIKYDRLSDIEVGRSVEIRRVDDKDPAVLRYLETLGLLPSVVVDVTEVAPFNGPLTVKVNDIKHALGRELASNIYVDPRKDDQSL